MKIRRALIALTVSVALAAGALGGCGSDDQGSGEDAAESDSAEQTTTQPSGGAAY